VSNLVARVLANKMAELKRLALLPRCSFRRVQEHKCEKTGEVRHEIGDPCGGRMKPKKLRREVVAMECVKCGRGAEEKAA
jgi:hypothetical protein